MLFLDLEDFPGESSEIRKSGKATEAQQPLVQATSSSRERVLNSTSAEVSGRMIQQEAERD